MRNEDILRIMKNIDKTIPYDNIREANKVYESVSSQLYCVEGIAESVRLMNSGLEVMEQSYNSMVKNLEIYSNIANFVSNFNYNILT